MGAQNGSEDGDAGRNAVWFINRGVVVVRPREPYVAWVNSVGDDDVPLKLQELRAEPDAFLIPEFDTRDESLEWLEEGCGLIFEMQLDAWETDEQRWPQDRSWSVFQEWFDVEFIEIAWDLVAEPLSSAMPEED